MAVKKSNVIGLALLLALAVSPASGVFAQSGNNLVQLDLKRASNDAVNVTLFTSDNYNENILVRKKSDNKYVILVPKIQSSGYSSPNLNGLKDLVSNIDVKTVNDTSGGYTKVTLITTKPLDIKTSTKQSGPVTEEQKAYKTLIAEANTVKNTIAKPQEPPKKVQPKTEITVNKAADTQVKPAVNTKKTQPETSLKPTAYNTQKQEVKPKTTVQKAEVKPNIELTEISNENLEKQARKNRLTELINEAKQEQADKQVPAESITNVTADTNPPSDVKNIEEMPKTAKVSSSVSLKNKIKTAFNHIPKKAGIAVFSMLALLMLLKTLSSAAKNKNAGQMSDMPVNYRPSPTNTDTYKYNNITNNKELSWQEKYQRYLDASAKPVSRGKNKGNYTFIKTPSEPPEVTQKRDELEKLLEEMPAYQNQDIQPEIVEDVVQSEDNAIPNTIKFKAFDNHKPTLEVADRNKIKSRFKKYEVEIPLHEQKNIDLGTSPLHSNPRSLKDANLNIADVDKNRIKYKPTKYIMSSVDEYFSILDKEQEAVPVIKAETSVPQMRKTGNSQTNPISKLRNETKSSYLNNLIIKSGFNIDENKGFYMVNLDGKSALIGKINDEITVLKKYDKVVDTPVQVRHDNANVYMVKAENFKSLVEVNDDKMGVLIEL